MRGSLHASRQRNLYCLEQIVPCKLRRHNELLLLHCGCGDVEYAALTTSTLSNELCTKGCMVQCTFSYLISAHH